MNATSAGEPQANARAADAQDGRRQDPQNRGQDVIRPAVEVLEGVTGPGARATWDAHEEVGNHERLNAVLRFLFAAIRIGESHAPSGRFDYGRIDMEQNKL